LARSFDGGPVFRRKLLVTLPYEKVCPNTSIKQPKFLWKCNSIIQMVLQDNQPVTGPHGNNERSENGLQLQEFMSINNLVSTATFFKKNNHNAWSWQGNGENEKQMDHIITK
jgi:hypothetical protein